MECCFAMDIGGTSAKYGMVDKNGRISQTGRFLTGENLGIQPFLTRFFAATDRAVQAGAQAIGIASLGWVDSENARFVGGIENLPYLAQADFPTFIRRRYGDIPVRLCNDVSAAALGEMRFGAARGCDNFLCLAIGTGIGGAIVLDGRLLEGCHFRAGEFGYWDFEEPNQYLEKEVSAKRMVFAASQALGNSEMDGIKFFERIRNQDPVCVQILEQQMEKLGRCVANLEIALDVERVVIGGGISAAADVLIPVLSKKVDNHLPPALRGQCNILAAQRGNDAAMLGAVSGLLPTIKEDEADF